MAGTEPDNGPSPRRLMVVGALLLVGLAVLVGRAVDLQVLDSGFLQSEGDARHLRVVDIPAHRGNILDRHGEPLAVSTPVDSVWVKPEDFLAARERWPELARTLGLDPQRMADFVEARQGRSFVYLRRQVSPEVAREATELGLPGVHLRREYRRYYPTGEVAAQLVGMTDIDEKGIAGLEMAWEEQLSGRVGKKRVIKDRLGHVVEDVERLRPPEPGENLRLTLDRRLQYLAYRELKAAVTRHDAKGGSAVILDARSAEVLAMVNQPSFNPNNRDNASGASGRNRAVTDLLEPGSTIKPFIAAAALASGRFEPDTEVETGNGYHRVAGMEIRDVRGYGTLEVAGVIRKSSNIGAAKIALETPPERLWGTLSALGFGGTSGSGFPGEANGHLGDFFQWGKVERATLGFGYGISTTPLQLARAYTVLARDGVRKPVRFVADRNPGVREQVLDPEVQRAVRRMMEAVVAPGGTGHRADVPGYRVAGKTGTVKKAVAGGYADDRYQALFAGLIPASDPRLVMVVTIDEPRNGEYYGGQVAAPVFSRVMSGAVRLLDIPPDDLDEEQPRLAWREEGQ
ncbi:peptidoglycan synthetase FtsI [Thiohalospira halophila DSM 15071]|uniref:Peptidoglycan D,D-transpeptidase FtsI n=2 Tax=Thiohalospira halophila TaxID=381300 RepID=A0A1I1QSV0_9GAMM|nr:penicillin-binding transpeptidase domain-containing protein [Thiohalospira halophila]SFD25082.1 peptidoglycan synthetase FtsI [Thiohalospira halophila DSM 15071]